MGKGIEIKLVENYSDIENEMQVKDNLIHRIFVNMMATFYQNLFDMKNSTIKFLWLMLALFMATGVNAQTTTKKTSTKTKTTKSKSSAPVSKSVPVPVTVTLTSKCERNLMIFSGPKENLRDPKMRQIGGLSVNKLYLKTSDVVCIMDAKKKPTSCVTITKASSKLETNNAGTALVTP